MAGVEQAAAPGAAAPDETPEAATTPETRPADRPVGGQSGGPEAEPTTRAGRRAARRRSSQKAGRQSDAPDDRKPAQHVAPSGPAEEPAGDHAAPDGDDAEPAGQHAADPGTTADTEPSGQHATTGTHATTGDRDPGRVSLVKARPAHAREDDPAETQDDTAEPTPEPTREPATGSTSNGSRAARTSGPAHAGAPNYRPRHAKRNRRRWPVLLTAGLVLVALAGVGAAALVNRQDDGTDGATAPAATHIAPAPANLPTGPSGTASAPPPAAAAPAAPGTTACRFNPAPDKTPNIVPPAVATRTGLVTATIGTSRGPISLELDATNAPCTVKSFLTLAAGGFFNDTACHRLTTMLIFVLQCGDPTALGSGDPGYSFDDENLPAPGGTPYPRGTLAMANAGPDTNGSQFFIVYKDSPIDPNYPVFGRVTGGLEIVDQVAGRGAPGNDGQPNESLVIQAVQLA